MQLLRFKGELVMKSRLSSIYIIAEAGVNHCGDFDLARKLIKAASDCGANAIKFQTFKSELMSTSKAKKADYQNSGDGDVVSHQKMLKDRTAITHCATCLRPLI